MIPKRVHSASHSSILGHAKHSETTTQQQWYSTEMAPVRRQNNGALLVLRHNAGDDVPHEATGHRILHNVQTCQLNNHNISVMRSLPCPLRVHLHKKRDKNETIVSMRMIDGIHIILPRNRMEGSPMSAIATDSFRLFPPDSEPAVLFSNLTRSI